MAPGRMSLRKAAIGLALIPLLLVAGLLAAPSMIGLDRLKAVIAAQIEQRTGRPIDIAGPLRLVLLPTPSLSLRDLRLANPPGAAGDLIRIRAVHLKLAFWPLLAGRVELRSAELIDPELDIERLPDGTGNWQSSAPAADGGAGFFVRRLDIENGSVTYRSGTRVERFEHIDAGLELDAPGGPFRIAGDLVSHGAALRFSADGGPAGDGALSLHTVISTKPAAQAEFDGTVGGPFDQPEIKGRLKLAVSDLASALTVLRRTPVSPVLARRFNLSADLTVAGRRIQLEHAAIGLGDALGDGTVDIAVGAPVQADLSVHVTRLDLDRMFEASSSAAGPAESVGLRTSPEPRPEPITAFAMPNDIRGSLDLSIDDLLWRGGVMRGASVKAVLQDGTLTVERLGALLPGSTTVSAAATLSSEKGMPRGGGRVTVEAADLRGLIGWLGYSADKVPADRLRGLSLSSQVTLAGDHLDFRADDATLDATRFQAAASVRLRGKPGITLHLAADHLNIDAYLASAETIHPLPGPAPSMAMGTPVLARLLEDLDADFDVQLGEAVWRGQSLRQLHLSGTRQDGSLSVDDLSVGDLGGAAGKLSGMVEGLAGGGLKGRLFFDAHGPAFERLLRLAWPDRSFGQSYGAFRLAGGAEIGQEQAELDTDIDVIGGHAHAAATRSAAANGIDLSVTVEHPSFATMMQTIFPAYRPAGGDLGALKLSAQMKAGAGRLDIGGFSLAIGSATASGSAGLAWDGARPRLTAAVTIGDWAVDAMLPARHAAASDDAADRFGPAPGIVLAQAGTAMPAPKRSAPNPGWSRRPIDWSELWTVDANVTLAGKSLSYGLWRLDQPAVTIALDDGTVDIAKVEGRLFGGPVEASAHLATKPSPSLRVQIALRDADLKSALATMANIKAIDGQFDLAGDLTTGGASELDLIANLGGTASLSARNGTLSGLDLRAFRDRLDGAGPPVDLPGLAKAVMGGTTRFSAFDGVFRLKDGIATGDDLHLAVEGGDGRGSAAIDLPAWTIDSRTEFQLANTAGMPPLVLRVAGNLDEPQEMLDSTMLSPFLARRAPLKNPGPHS